MGSARTALLGNDHYAFLVALLPCDGKPGSETQLARLSLGRQLLQTAKGEPPLSCPLVGRAAPTVAKSFSCALLGLDMDVRCHFGVYP